MGFKGWGRQPVHTVYGGAHLFKATTFARLGELARRSFAEHDVYDLPDAVRSRVARKLELEPVEDFRVDFEDGFGIRSDADEDAAVEAVAEAMDGAAMPYLFGIRVKPFSDELRGRALRTLRRFLDARRGLPERFVVTLPKVTSPDQVRELVDLTGPDMGIEIMVETPQSIFILPQLVDAARGQCIGAHFGAYDYTASLGITAAHQTIDHPACDFARGMMQAALASTGVWLADGATNILPIAPGDVREALLLHYRNVRRSLYNGFYQGWDLHPAQLPARYAAVYSFFFEGLEQASERLRNFVEVAARATQVRGVFDDAATGQGLLNYFLRAVNCGAVDHADVPGLTGLSLEELQTGSFVRIVQMRQT
jgi:citrate lyase beta subunit